jgi:hypothetical protein
MVNMNENLAYIIGLMLADGGIYKYKYRYKTAYKTLFTSDSSEEFANVIAQMIRETLHITPCIWKSKRDREIQVYSNRKQLVDFFEKLGIKVNRKATTVKIPMAIKDKSKKESIALLRGIFDGDGTLVLHRKNENGKTSITPCIKLKSMSRFLIKDVKEIVEKLGIKSIDYYSVSENVLYIIGKKEVLKF